jgi:uncharacterized protein
MRRLLAMVAMSGASACATAEMAAPDAPRADARVDAGDDEPDAEETRDAPLPIDAAPPVDGSAAASTLLLTEVVLTPNTGEFIEVHNPTGASVDLSNYYVTDVPTYFRLPAGTQTVDTSDFLGRFPAGASIAAGATITVAVDTATNYQLRYGVLPTYSLNGGTMIVQGVGTLNLTNTGEPIVLFYWDGTTDLVEDCDIVIAGVPTAGNALVNKTAIAVEGPDADALPSAYALDAQTIPTTTPPGSGVSMKRILLEAGHEIQAGTGNGIDGHDETSEEIGTTWDSTYSAPTPGATSL